MNLGNHARWRLSLAVLALLVAAAYGRSLALPHLWDDCLLVNPGPMTENRSGLADLYRTDLFGRGDDGPASEYFRPMATLTHRLEARLGAAAPAAGHGLNLALHIGATLLMVLLLLRLGAGRLSALLAGAVVGLHPVQTETVYWISARADILAVVFVQLALVVGTGEPLRIRRAAAMGTLFLLALLSKETALAAFPLVAGAGLLGPRSAGGVRRVLPGLCGGGAAITVWLAWRSAVGVFGFGDAGLATGRVLLADSLTVLGELATWIALQFDLATPRDHVPWPTAGLAVVALALVATAGLALAAWRRGCKTPLAAVTALACHGLLIGAAIRAIGATGQRYAYAALFYVVLGIASAAPIARLPLDADRRRRLKTGTVLVFGIAVLLWIPAIWTRAGAWGSERALFADAIAATGSSEAERLLASHLAHREGDFAGAAALYRERVEARPGDARSWNNLAACLIETRRFEEAREAASRARGLDPGRRSTWLNEATALAALGRGTEALALLDAYREWHTAPGDRGPPSLPLDGRYHQVRRLVEESVRGSTTRHGDKP